MSKRIILYCFAFLFFQILNAQKQNSQGGKIISGPMLGYVEHREALVWVQTACNKSVTIKYKKQNDSKIFTKSISNINTDKCEPWIAKFVLPLLDVNSEYTYQIFLDNAPVKFSYPLKFKTEKLWAPWSTNDPYEINFLFGSCNYVNDSAYDRPGKPYGQSTTIFNAMAKSNADFMIWLGDNTYLREADYSSISGINYRYLHTRVEKNLQPFLASMPQYAMWDDHDFGDDDASKNFAFANITRQCFIDYYGNNQYGENGQGTYFKFVKSDADFYLTDGRTFRDESKLDEKIFPQKTMLGKQQLEWLKNNLAHSTSTFKFICLGGQFLNSETTKESFNLFENERKEIMQFIADQKISGVIFISGDRHHCELLKYDSLANPGYAVPYTLYDITSSPLTSGVSGILNSPEKNNPHRVANTLFVGNNYCKMSITGKRNERVVTLFCYDRDGVEKWKYEIKEIELKMH